MHLTNCSSHTPPDGSFKRKIINRELLPAEWCPEETFVCDRKPVNLTNAVCTAHRRWELTMTEWLLSHPGALELGDGGVAYFADLPAPPQMA